MDLDLFGSDRGNGDSHIHDVYVMTGKFWRDFVRADAFGFKPGMGSQHRKCLACEGQITGPNVYGSGLYCSELCTKLRTREAYLQWKEQHDRETI